MPSGSKKRKSKKPSSPSPGGLPPPPVASADEPHAEGEIARRELSLDEDPQEEGDPFSPGRTEDGVGVDEGVGEEAEEQVDGAVELDGANEVDGEQTRGPWETEKDEQAGAIEANGGGFPPLLDDPISSALTVGAQEEDKTLGPAPVESEAPADLDMGVSAPEVETASIGNEPMAPLEGYKAAPAAQPEDEEKVLVDRESTIAEGERGGGERGGEGGAIVDDEVSVVVAEQADLGNGTEEDPKDVEKKDVSLNPDLLLKEDASIGVPSEPTPAEDHEADSNLQASLAEAGMGEQSEASIAELSTVSGEAARLEATEGAEAPHPVDIQGEAKSEPSLEEILSPVSVEDSDFEAPKDEGSQSGPTEPTGPEVTTEDAMPSVLPEGAEADCSSENVEAESFPLNSVEQTEDYGEAPISSAFEGTEAPLIEEAVPSANREGVESEAMPEEALPSACTTENEVTEESGQSSALPDEVDAESPIEGGEAAEESGQSALAEEYKVRAAAEESVRPDFNKDEVGTEEVDAAEESVQPALPEDEFGREEGEGAEESMQPALAAEGEVEVATEEVGGAEGSVQPAFAEDELATEEGEAAEESVQPALAAEEVDAAPEEGEVAGQAAYADDDKGKPANKEGEAAEASVQPALAEDELDAEEGEAAEESVERALTGDGVATEEGKAAEASVQPARTDDEVATEAGGAIEESLQPALTEAEGATEEVTAAYPAEEGEFGDVPSEETEAGEVPAVEAKDSNEFAIGEFVPSASIEQDELPSNDASEAATTGEEQMTSDSDARDIGSLPGGNDSKGERDASDFLEQCDVLNADVVKQNGMIQEEMKEGDSGFCEGEPNIPLSVEGSEGVESAAADQKGVSEPEVLVMSERSLLPAKGLESIDTTKYFNGNEVEVSPLPSTEGLEGIEGSVHSIEQEQVGSTPIESKIVAVDEASSEPGNGFLDEKEEPTLNEVLVAEAEMPGRCKLEHVPPLEEQQNREEARSYGILDGSTQELGQPTDHTANIDSSLTEKQMPHGSSPEELVEFGEEQSSLEESGAAKGKGRVDGGQTNRNKYEVMVVDNEKGVSPQLANEFRGMEDSTNGFDESSEDPILESSVPVRFDSVECKLLQDAAESLPVVEASLSKRERSTSLPLVARVPEKEVHVDQRSLKQKGSSSVQGPMAIARKNKWLGCCGLFDALLQRK